MSENDSTFGRNTVYPVVAIRLAGRILQYNSRCEIEIIQQNEFFVFQIPVLQTLTK